MGRKSRFQIEQIGFSYTVGQEHFRSQLFRSSDPIHASRRKTRVFLRDSWAKFLDRTNFWSPLHPSKHTVKPHSSSLDTSLILGWLLYCCCCCSTAAVAAAHSAAPPRPARRTRRSFQNIFACNTPKSTKSTNSIRLTIGSTHTASNLEWIGNRPFQSFQSDG